MYTVGAMKRGMSPMLLATLAIGGAGLAAASYFVNVLDLPRFPAAGNGVWARAWADRLHLTLFLVPMVLGIAICLWAQWRFKRELQEERWSEASLAPVRSLLSRPWWGWTCAVRRGLSAFYMHKERLKWSGVPSHIAV
jgi:hypothetical protein